jgi:Tfp pilus assembly PilM family ATPase
MSSLFSLTDAASPDVALEIASGRVSAALLERRTGKPAIAAHVVELLPAAALVPSLTAVNTHDRPAVMTAINRALEKVGRPRRIALVVPDAVAKVSLVRFEKVPPRAADLEQLIRWQVRKTAPFPIEEAQVSYARGLHTSEGQEFIVTLARRAVVEEYEGLCTEAGAYAGVVDLATVNVINAVLAGLGPSGAAETGDWLLINMAADSSSIAILRGADVIFFRNRLADADGTVADLVHQTGMYYEDRLQGAGFSRVLVCGGSQAAEDVRQLLQDRLTAPVESIDPRAAAALTDRITASPALLDTLAPLVGILLRDRAAVTA